MKKSLQNQQSRMRKKNLLSLKNQQNLVKMKEEPMLSPQSHESAQSAELNGH
jgi:hypothetical protein